MKLELEGMNAKFIKSFVSLECNERFIQINRNGDISDKVYWLKESDIISLWLPYGTASSYYAHLEELYPNFMYCLNEKVKNKFDLPDGIADELRNELKTDLSRFLKNEESFWENFLEEAIKLTYSMSRSNGNWICIDAGVSQCSEYPESGVCQNLGYDTSMFTSVGKKLQELSGYYSRLLEYDLEFKRMLSKLNDIPGESEELNKSKDIFSNNYALLGSSLIAEGKPLKEEFRINKEQVKKLMSSKYSTFAEMIESLG